MSTVSTMTLSQLAWLAWWDSKSTRMTCAEEILSRPESDDTVKDLARRILDSPGGPAGTQERNVVIAQLIEYLDVEDPD